ncbi:CopG family transcriptional regulator [Acidianus manzaensis]|uniref:CopG family transcriptional regulator n=1 Tax=Acidianus manzaensis TaxID=282676 RepID=A0A1W6JYS7_9CREN|nr:CopG family transcriptional regulator [Acidianus manzaensis]ARM75426.1 CopG family transcriptional regulator [Acidianus manzaensis]
MGKTVILSVRIPEELKRDLEKYNIDETEVIRRALIMEVKKAKAEELNKDLKNMDNILRKLSVEDGIKSIREDRENR